MLLSRRGGAYWWPSWYPDCSYVLRGELKWIWITRTSCNSVRLRMVRCNKGDKSAFNSMYIFCQSNLGCYCSSLWFCLDGRNIRFTLENCLIPHFPFFFFFFFPVFSNITYLYFFQSHFKDFCAVFTFKGHTVFLICWVSQTEQKRMSLITVATMALWVK